MAVERLELAGRGQEQRVVAGDLGDVRRVAGADPENEIASLLIVMSGFSLSNSAITFSIPGRVAPSAAAQLANVSVIF
jgi:hypothetical protein